MSAKIGTVDNIMEAIRLLDLESTPQVAVDSQDLVAIINEIVAQRNEVRTLKALVMSKERNLNNALHVGFKYMSEQIPHLDIKV